MAKALIYTTGLLKTNMPLAKHIAKEAKTDIFNLKDLSRLNLEAYDTIIFGTANHGGKPDQPVLDFANANADVLKKKKLMLYVVVSDMGEKSIQQADAIAETMGIPGPVCLPKKGEAGEEFAAEVEAFIKSL